MEKLNKIYFKILHLSNIRLAVRSENSVKSEFNLYNTPVEN